MPDNIKLLIIIADKTKQKDITKIIKKYNLYFNYIIPGYGSASSSLLDYFGLNEVKKQIYLSVFFTFFEEATSINDLNRGCGLLGRDLNSGWN